MSIKLTGKLGLTGSYRKARLSFGHYENYSKMQRRLYDTRENYLRTPAFLRMTPMGSTKKFPAIGSRHPEYSRSCL